MQASDLTVRALVKQTIVILLILGIACIPSIGQEIALGLLIVAACVSPAWALRSLAMGIVVFYVSSPIASGGIEEAFHVTVAMTVLKWLLLLVAFGRSLLTRVEPSEAYVRLVYCWIALTVVLLLNSFVVSIFPAVSAFKSISFSLGLICVLRLSMLTAKRNTELLVFVAALGTAVFIASVPLLGMSAGRSRNGVSFNGILYHPQVLGVTLLMTGAAAFVAAIRAPRISRVLVLAGLAQWAMIPLTRSRTPLMALALGATVYLCEAFVNRGRDIKVRYLLTPAGVLAIYGLILAAVLTPGIREGLVSYLEKDKSKVFDSDNPELSLSESSRGKQVYNTLELAEEHPLFGAGFGVNEDSESNLAANGAQLGGIPLSAPVEQGFLPLASVAQLGIVGSLFVLPFVISIYSLARRESVDTVALFAAVLGVNFGEMIFYSNGGSGLLMWILLMLFAVSGASPRRPVRILSR